MLTELARKFSRLNWGLLAVILALCAISVACIYSATYTSDSAELREAFCAQIFWIPIGLAAFFVMALVDYSTWLRAVAPMLIIVGILLIVVHFQPPVNGARNWIRLGPVGVQPSELAKIVYVLGMTLFLLKREEKIEQFSTFASVIGLTLIPMALILKQPDLGSAAVFLPMAFVMMYMAGVRLRYLLLPVFLGIVVIAYTYFGVYKRDWKIPGLKPYQVNRIKIFYDPNMDPKNAGWQINQSLLAIGSGGLTGKGWCQGTQNILGYLPKDSAHNDFIFSVIGEEFGFVGGSIIIIMHGIILVVCLRAASAARDQAGMLICCGITAMLFTHIFINTGMTMQVVPITGIPLPFISYGGTFLVVCMAAIGLVQSVWIHRRVY
jgi:rod shape determining protein RodA